MGAFIPLLMENGLAAKVKEMAIRTNFLDRVTVSDEYGRAFTQKLVFRRGTRAAVIPARNGRILANGFTSLIQAKPSQKTSKVVV